VRLTANFDRDLTPSEGSVFYAYRVPGLRQRGAGWRGPCPLHGGTDDNFAVNTENGDWYYHSQCGRGGSIVDLEVALTKVDFRAALQQVHERVGRIEYHSDIPATAWGLPNWQHEYLRQRIAKVEAEQGWKQNAMYPYLHAEGGFAYVKVRFVNESGQKTFQQYGLSSKGGWVTRKTAGKQLILYRLNTISGADEIFVVNGEKAADRGASELAIVTTCSPDGEGKWSSSYTQMLTGKCVRIIVDNDEKGEQHGVIIGRAIGPYVREVKVIRLPGLPPKGDLWDWIEVGGTREQLIDIVARTPAFGLSESPKLQGPKPAPAADDRKLLRQLRSDTGNAERLVLMFGHCLRYCPAFRKWLVWDDRRWAINSEGAAIRFAKQAMREYLLQAKHADEIEHINFAQGALNVRRIKNMLTLAECELVVSPDQLDALPYHLNFLNGTLDLRTSVLAPHNPNQYITKQVSCISELHCKGHG